MLFLASQSPRRRALLEQIGLDPRLLEVEVPEVRQPGEPALDYVNRVAREKAGAGLLKVVSVPGARVLAADTEVILGDEVFGKPADAEDAACMLRRLSGRTHRVATVVWLLSAGSEASATSLSEVRFSSLDEPLLAAYLASGEWRGKAGAYAIQGRAAAFIEHLSGSYSGVMGLPLHETARLLRLAGVMP
jgi:septum formation protein